MTTSTITPTIAAAIAADAYEDAWKVGYFMAKRFYRNYKYFRNEYPIRSPQWCGYEAYRDALAEAVKAGEAA